MKLRTFQNPDDERLRPFTSPTACGLGWEICYYKGYKVVSHDGSIPGFGTCHFFLPDFRFGGAVFGNSGGGGRVATILAHELIDEVLGVAETERLGWNKIEAEYDSDNELGDENKLRQKLCHDITKSQSQKMPLVAYTGEYWNPGYHSLTVEIKNGKLFIDATNRSMGFTLAFDHVSEQTKYIAHLSDFLEGGDDPLEAEFNFDNDRAVKMGLNLEPELEELIWFDKVQTDS
jgi:hypothetical protein